VLSIAALQRLRGGGGWKWCCDIPLRTAGCMVGLPEASVGLVCLVAGGTQVLCLAGSARLGQRMILCGERIRWR